MTHAPWLVLSLCLWRHRCAWRVRSSRLADGDKVIFVVAVFHESLNRFKNLLNSRLRVGCIMHYQYTHSWTIRANKSCGHVEFDCIPSIHWNMFSSQPHWVLYRKVALGLDLDKLKVGSSSLRHFLSVNGIMLMGFRWEVSLCKAWSSSGSFTISVVDGRR